MVSLQHEPGSRSVMVTVEDDGRGFDIDKAAGPEQGHFGLQGMRERIDALTGSLVITSEPGRVTRVTAQVTVRAHDDEMEVSSFGGGVSAAESGE
jgi:two-component system NarL family sensor kinase